MGRVKELLTEFCEVIYPDDYDRQDKLFRDMMESPNHDPIPNLTPQKFREFYEKNGIPAVTLEEMARIVRENPLDG